MELSPKVCVLEDQERGLSDENCRFSPKLSVLTQIRIVVRLISLWTRELSLTRRWNLQIWRRSCVPLRKACQPTGRLCQSPLRIQITCRISWWQLLQNCRLQRGRYLRIFDQPIKMQGSAWMAEVAVEAWIESKIWNNIQTIWIKLSRALRLITWMWKDTSRHWGWICSNKVGGYAQKSTVV